MGVPGVHSKEMGRRVLIVDDEPYLLRILSFKLRREGYETVEARCAEEAERAIQHRPVDLIILDVALATPTNGFDLAAKLQPTPPLAHPHHHADRARVLDGRPAWT